jgi:hypothetical protein
MSKRRILWLLLTALVLVGAFVFFVTYSMREGIYVEDTLDEKICSMTILQDQPFLELCSDGRKVNLSIARENFSGHYYFNDVQQFVIGGQTRIQKEAQSSLIVLTNPDGGELRIQFTVLPGGMLTGGEILEAD